MDLTSEKHADHLHDLLADGHVREFNTLNGTPYRISGLVIHGNHLGRTLGFPTANLDLTEKDKFILAHGVYAVMAKVHNQCYRGMANVGIRPTINGKTLTVEVNLFDFDGDLYDQTLEIEFIDRIRDEKKFNSLTDLAEQITKDKLEALKLLS